MVNNTRKVLSKFMLQIKIHISKISQLWEPDTKQGNLSSCFKFHMLHGHNHVASYYEYACIYIFGEVHFFNKLEIILCIYFGFEVKSI